MRKHLRLRIGIVVVVILASLAYLDVHIMVARLFGYNRPAPTPINLGLDLQGGIHLVLGVDVDKAVEAQVERAGDSVRAELEKKGIGVAKIERRGPTELVVRLASPQPWNDAQSVFRDMAIFETKEADQGAGRVVLTLRPREAAAIKDLAVRQGLETIRNRVDQFGVAEPSIQQQGENRILVQLPGVQDPERAKALIGKTALLEFKLLDDRMDAETALRSGIPEGDEILYQRRVDKETKQERKIPYLVQKKVLLTGRDLATARVSIDQNTSEPYVSVDFNAAGAKAFADLTDANVGRRLAIILDGNIHSAPQIRERIPSGRAQITGGFSSDEATDLAIVLRAGALPAPVQVLEERTVGPSLGADNIKKGFDSTVYGFAALSLFIVVYYSLFGGFSVLALCANLLFLIALLSMLQATLTLPGIAAIALTLGMAIDANVLINERVREELRSGMSPQMAIQAGYERAFGTILDSNVTTLIVGLMLLAFGSGPVRGFAVVHCLGILTSIFSAVVVSRGIVNLIYGGRRKVPRLSIGNVDWHRNQKAAV